MYSRQATGQRKILSFLAAAAPLFWTAALTGLLLWAVTKEKRQILNYARMEARANFNKDIALRNVLQIGIGWRIPGNRDIHTSSSG
ncbi:hypothetical protein VT98_10621, partial [Candidatus Electrothrix communis]